jgi:hypothetical protein
MLPPGRSLGSISPAYIRAAFAGVDPKSTKRLTAQNYQKYKEKEDCKKLFFLLSRSQSYKNISFELIECALLQFRKTSIYICGHVCSNTSSKKFTLKKSFTAKFIFELLFA